VLAAGTCLKAVSYRNPFLKIHLIMFVFLVTKNGVIPGSVVVYKVAAKATTDDYHKNVGIEEFTKWHNKLQEILREMGGNYIIVMVTFIILLNQHI
jgi:hypothetical protein